MERLKDRIGAFDCARIGELLKDVKIVLFSEIPKDDVLKLNLEFAESLQRSVEEALARYDSNAKIIVLRGASEMIPIISKE